MKKILFFLFILVMVVCMDVPVSKAQQKVSLKEWKIGNIVDITGPFTNFGIPLLRGQEKATEDINAAGDVRGGKIVLVSEDSRSDRIEGLTLIKKLAPNKDILCLSILASQVLIAGHPLFEEFRIPVVSNAANPWRLTPYKGVFNKWTFRQQPIADATVPIMLSKLKPKLNLKRVATIYDIKNDWTVTNQRAFVEISKKLDLDVTAVESCITGDTDFRAQITKMRLTDPDLVFVSCTSHEKAFFIRQARDMGWKVQFMDLLAQPPEFKLSGGAEEGLISCTPFDATEDRPLVKMLVKWHQEKYGAKIEPNTGLGYDNVMIIADAIKRAKTIDREGIRDALGSTKNFEGACGFYTWDGCGDNLTPLIHFVTFNKAGELVTYKF
jgi:branched-chain amino acid transport system substrate-binding protein